MASGITLDNVIEQNGTVVYAILMLLLKKPNAVYLRQIAKQAFLSKDLIFISVFIKLMLCETGKIRTILVLFCFDRIGIYNQKTVSVFLSGENIYRIVFVT